MCPGLIPVISVTTLSGSPVTEMTGWPLNRAGRPLNRLQPIRGRPMTLTSWMRQAGVDEGAGSRRNTGESAEFHALRR